jgi:hypothetical protein
MTLTALLCAAAVLLSATAALAQENAAREGVPAGAAAERHKQEEAAKLDCADFATQRGAQAVLSQASLSAQEDRFGLDEDGDGVACENGDGGVAEDGTLLGADTSGDRDCNDWPSQKAAQAHLRANPSDPYKLDPDRNGVACEFLAAPYKDDAIDTTPVVGARSGADLGCENFEFQQEAQAVYLRDESDPNKLDEDGDGLACEGIPILESNAEEVLAADAKSAGAPPPSAALGGTSPRGDGIVELPLGLAALFLTASGALLLVTVWRVPRRSSRGKLPVDARDA